MTLEQIKEFAELLRSSKEVAHNLRRLAGKDRSSHERLVMQTASNNLDIYREFIDRMIGEMK